MDKASGGAQDPIRRSPEKKNRQDKEKLLIDHVSYDAKLFELRYWRVITADKDRWRRILEKVKTQQYLSLIHI